MEENNKQKNGLLITYFLLFLISIGIVATARFLYSIGDLACFRLLCIVIFGHIMVIFSINTHMFYDQISKVNLGENRFFYAAYIILLIISLFLPKLPVESWPVIVFFVLLVILSNFASGILAGSICLIISFSLGGAGYFSYFIFYFLCGITCALLFAKLDYEFRIGFPILIIEVVLLTGLAIIAITSGTSFTIELLLFPLANAAASLLLILFILKLYSNKVLFVEKDKYLEFNNPECLLLTELRNCSPEDYHKTVHIVYFCDRIARCLEVDENIVKCAGLYHRVGVIGGDNNWDNTYLICKEQNLPEEVMKVLHEFLDSSIDLKSPEAAILYMSECIVTSITYLFKKNENIQLDYPSLVDAIFKQRIETGIFKHCDITINQFEQMKKVFVEEKLYYDFLR